MTFSLSTLRNHYDIAVVGAGPAGLSAVLSALSTVDAPSVVLIDKQIPWENPIACAEATGRLSIEEIMPIDPKWIRFEVGTAAFHAPSGATVIYVDKNKGYILDRAGMQKDLALRCKEKGADCTFNRRVTHVSRYENGRRTLLFHDGRTVSASVVVDASGPLSFIGKNENISWKCRDLEPAYFAVVNNIDLPRDTVHIYVGEKIAPGGYAWVFPRDEKTSNAGVVIGASFRGKVNIRTLLDDFLQRELPNVKEVTRFAGSIPCATTRQPIATAGLLKAGDAASTANPVSRAGIAEAMLCGKIAGQFAVDMLGSENERHMMRLCRNYEKAWFEKRGKRHFKLAQVKGSLARIPDSDYNRAAESLARIPTNELMMSKIFTLSLGRFPRLVWAMRHLL